VVFKVATRPTPGGWGGHGHRHSGALHPTPTTVPLPFLLALQPLGDAQFSPFPEAVDFGGEVLGKQGGIEHQQGFVVLVGGGGAPVEGAGDHGAVVDHSHLIKPRWQIGRGGGAVGGEEGAKATVQAIGGLVGAYGLASERLRSKPNGSAGGSFEETTCSAK
jgi:hypothetical protein